MCVSDTPCYSILRYEIGGGGGGDGAKARLEVAMRKAEADTLVLVSGTNIAVLLCC